MNPTEDPFAAALNQLSARFAAVEDPRMERTKQHRLLDIITIAICAVICGADAWTEIEQFGLDKEDFFRRFLPLPNGIPSHDTFRRVFALLKPAQFEACFAEWVRDVVELAAGQVVALDGKTLRRSASNRLITCWR